MSNNLISRRAQKHSRTIETWFEEVPLGKPCPDKKLYDMSAGDPSAFAFDFNKIEDDQVKSKLLDPKSMFHCHEEDLSVRTKIAQLHSGTEHKYSPEDVFITQGGEFALTYALRLLCAEGDNCIVPVPGYWHLDMTGPCYDVEVRSYGFLNDGKWTIDFEALEKKIDSRTRFILVVSPGNPNCVFYSDEVLSKFNELAQKYSLFLVSDEIYINCYFDTNQKHNSVSQLKPDVPVITMAGMAKMAVTPGYCYEWLLLKDTQNKFPQVRTALQGIEASFGGNSAFLTNIVSRIMDIQASTHKTRMQYAKSNFDRLSELMAECKGLKLLTSTASMFGSVLIETSYFPSELHTDHAFCSKLYAEEGVKIGRGLFNGMIGLLRISLFLPKEHYDTAIPRLIAFCNKYVVNSH